MEISARFGSITIYKSGNNTTAALLPRECHLAMPGFARLPTLGIGNPLKWYYVLPRHSDIQTRIPDKNSSFQVVWMS